MFFELIIIGWLVIGSGRIFEVGCLITYMQYYIRFVFSFSIFKINLS